MTVIVLDQMRSVTITAVTPTTAVTVNQTGMQGPQGNPTTVNGKSGASITLTASDVGAIATTARGAVNGVASLDSGGLVPYSQLPVTTIAGSFMDLSTNQTVSTGIKTFSVSPVVPTPTTSGQAANKGYADLMLPLTGGTMTGAIAGLLAATLTGSTASGGTLTLTSSSNATKGKILLGTSAYDEVNNRLGLAQTTPAVALHITSGASGNLVARTDVTGDTVGRFTIAASGAHAWGPGGSTATDTTLSRSGVGQLTSNAQFLLNGSNAAGLLFIQNGVATTTDPGTISIQETASGNMSIGTYITGDTNPRFQIAASGLHQWGPGGSTAVDTNLYRTSAGVLKTDQSLTVAGTATVNTQLLVSGTANPILRATSSTTGGQIIQAVAADVTSVSFETEVTGDTVNRWVVKASGAHEWGPGGATARDTFTGRAGVGQHYVSPTLIVGGTAALGDNGSGEIQFTNATTIPTTNPTGGGVMYAKQAIPQWRDTGGLLLGMVRNYNADSTSNLASWTTETDVPGATVSVVVTGSNATVTVDAQFDFQAQSPAGVTTFQGYLNWNGADRSQQCIFVATSGTSRACVARTWTITGVTAGTYVAKLRAQCSINSANNTCQSPHTGISVQVTEG